MTSPLSVRVDTEGQDCVYWLTLHGYQYIVDGIEELTRKWKAQAKGTRKDWWVILAGTPEGEPRRVSGFFFPVLKAARRRQGYPPDVPWAIENSPHELAPSIKQQAARWGKRFKRSMRS